MASQDASVDYSWHAKRINETLTNYEINIPCIFLEMQKQKETS